MVEEEKRFRVSAIISFDVEAQDKWEAKKIVDKRIYEVKDVEIFEIKKVEQK